MSYHEYYNPAYGEIGASTLIHFSQNMEVATNVKICWPLPSNQSFIIGKLSATGGACMGDCRIVK